MGKKGKIISFVFILSLLLNMVCFIYAVRKGYWRACENYIVSRFHENETADKNILYSFGTACILTFGQSNSANYGQGSYHCRNAVYEYFKGEVYKVSEPLRGANGNGCSVWTRFSDMLIDSGLYQRVVILPIGIGSTSVYCWSEGACNEKLRETLQYIEKDSIKITHVIWHQGEADNIENTPKEVYKTRLKKIFSQIRQHGIKADFYVCQASYHPDVTTKYNGIDTAIQNAQLEFTRENPGTKLCVNTDSFNLASDRYDGVHFSVSGLDKFARELYRKVKN